MARAIASSRGARLAYSSWPTQVVLQRQLHVVGDFGGALVVVAPGVGAGAALAPRVFDDFGFDGDFGCRLRIDALFLRHRMRFERFEGAGGLVFVHGLEHHVAFELLADVRLQLQCRHLQEADRLLQLRGHGELSDPASAAMRASSSTLAQVSPTL